MNLRNRLSVLVVICHNLWTTLLINELVLTRIDIILQSEKCWEKYFTIENSLCIQVDEWGPTDIFVPNKDILTVVKAKLQQHGLPYRILIDDVGR